jgi:hypothetical protein
MTVDVDVPSFITARLRVESPCPKASMLIQRKRYSGTAYLRFVFRSSVASLDAYLFNTAHKGFHATARVGGVNSKHRPHWASALKHYLLRPCFLPPPLGFGVAFFFPVCDALANPDGFFDALRFGIEPPLTLQQQHEGDHGDHHSQNATGIVAPPAAVRIDRQCADQKQYK